MPGKVLAAYVVLFLFVAGVACSLVVAMWQEPECRVVMLIFGMAALLFWAIHVLVDWIDDPRNIK